MVKENSEETKGGNAGWADQTGPHALGLWELSKPQRRSTQPEQLGVFQKPFSCLFREGSLQVDTLLVKYGCLWGFQVRILGPHVSSSLVHIRRQDPLLWLHIFTAHFLLNSSLTAAVCIDPPVFASHTVSLVPFADWPTWEQAQASHLWLPCSVSYPALCRLGAW